MRFFDLHCDTPYRCFTENIDFKNPTLAVSPDKGKVFSSWHQCFAVWISDNCTEPYIRYRAIISDFKEKLCSAPENLTAYFTLENASLIDSAEKLYILKNDGIRAITLTWNGENAIAGGAFSDKGLTAFGKEVIKLMNELGIYCDLSHLNRKSFYSAIEIAKYPLASHSNAYSVCPHRRNLTDEQLKLISEKGGIVGLCFYPQFLGGEPFEKIYENISVLLDLGLESSLALGSDFDGAEMHKNLDSVEKVTDLYAFLRGKGLGKSLLDKIFYCNAVKFFDKTVRMLYNIRE